MGNPNRSCPKRPPSYFLNTLSAHDAHPCPFVRFLRSLDGEPKQAFMRLDENLIRFNSLFSGDGPNRLFVYFQAADRGNEASAPLVRSCNICTVVDFLPPTPATVQYYLCNVFSCSYPFFLSSGVTYIAYTPPPPPPLSRIPSLLSPHRTIPWIPLVVSLPLFVDIRALYVRVLSLTAHRRRP